MTALPSFGTCTRKASARTATIMQPWFDRTGLCAIPKDRAYITLCGPLFDDHGGLQPSCELLHLIDEGFVAATQFHGVERDAEIHALNVAAVDRNLPIRQRPHLHHADLVEFLDDARSIRPAVVNIDLIDGPLKGVTVLARSLSILNRFKPPIMVTWNFVVKTPYRLSDQRMQVPRALSHDLLRQAVIEGGWEWYGPLEYDGTGTRRFTRMRTYVLWRPR